MGWSASWRQQLRSGERKLRAAGVTMEWIDPPHMSDEVLHTLFSLHQECWSNRSRRTSFTTEQRPLHRRLIEASAAGRGPAAVIAHQQGRPIGVLYGFWWKQVFAYYQMGWDPTFAQYGLGNALLREGIRMTAGRGGRVFDFLRGTESFKYRFHATDRVDTTWLIPRGWPGSLLILSFTSRRLLRAVRARSHRGWRLRSNGVNTS